MALRIKLLLLLSSVVILTACANTSVIDADLKQDALQINSSEPDDRFAAAQARLKLGFAYLNEGELELAKLNMYKAFQYASEDYQVQLGVALYEQTVANYDAAELRYKRAIALAPNNGAVLNNYGAFLCHLRQYDKAHQQFINVINSFDSTYLADSLENAGYCFVQEGNLEQAALQLKQALIRQPDKGEYLIATANEYFKRNDQVVAKMLSRAYSETLPDTAASVWLQLRIALFENRVKDVKHLGGLLAKNHSQSKEYQQLLANEY